jgi:hypothetical protein
VSRSDNIYLMLTEGNPKRYWRLVGGTVVSKAIKQIQGIKRAE